MADFFPPFRPATKQDVRSGIRVLLGLLPVILLLRAEKNNIELTTVFNAALSTQFALWLAVTGYLIFIIGLLGKRMWMFFVLIGSGLLAFSTASHFRILFALTFLGSSVAGLVWFITITNWGSKNPLQNMLDSWAVVFRKTKKTPQI